MKENLARVLSDYGMLVVLVLLCGYYSWVTWSERESVGAAGADQVAAVFDSGERVLVLVGKGADDAAFARRIADRAKAKGFEIVESVQGTPIDARAAIERAADAGGPIHAIAVTQATRAWGLFDNVETKFPALAGVRFVAPRAYSWPVFLTRDNLLNIVNQIVVIAIIAIGMTMVIITAGIDLSVGSLIALSAVATTLIVRDFGGGNDASTGTLVLACVAGIAACALVGLFTGAMVTGFGIPPFIVTLAMMLVASGMAFNIADGQSIYDVPAGFTWLGRGATLGVPNAVWLLVVLYAVAHIVMTRMTLGRCIYAIGGNAEAARLSGVPVRRVLLLVYAVSGATAGLGGVVMASQLGAGAPTYGVMYELYVIAAVVVGGTSLMGGEGKVLGTLIGAFIIAVIANGMNLTNVDPYNQKVVLGTVILAAVLLDMVKKKGWGRFNLFRLRATPPEAPKAEPDPVDPKPEPDTTSSKRTTTHAAS